MWPKFEAAAVIWRSRRFSGMVWKVQICMEQLLHRICYILGLSNQLNFVTTILVHDFGTYYSLTERESDQTQWSKPFTIARPWKLTRHSIRPNFPRLHQLELISFLLHPSPLYDDPISPIHFLSCIYIPSILNQLLSKDAEGTMNLNVWFPRVWKVVIVATIGCVPL